ncbi:hypothetical protein ACQBAT_01825 [Ornithinimicrobium sp. Y1847]|uniref:hypothetical protein n=1 Tax=Ornithinimicrobium sp. Y1847 TaxID=3405419 RepID=UPI003D00F41C
MSTITRATTPGVEQLDAFVADYILAGATEAARKCRRLGVIGFRRAFGDLDGWNHAPGAARRQVRTEVASFAAHAAVATGLQVDPAFVVTSCCRWGSYVRQAYPAQHALFMSQAADLGFCTKEIGRMWTHLSRIAVIAGTSPAALTPDPSSTPPPGPPSSNTRSPGTAGTCRTGRYPRRCSAWTP